MTSSVTPISSNASKLNQRGNNGVVTVQGARKSGKLSEVMVGTIPYVCMMLVMIVLLIAFPNIALFLPNALQ